MLRQQRLNEKQWGAGVTKMVGWGADVPDAKRDELIAYLVEELRARQRPLQARRDPPRRALST